MFDINGTWVDLDVDGRRPDTLRGPEDLTDVAPLQDPNYSAVTLGLDRLEVAQRVSLGCVSLISWEVVSVEFFDLLGSEFRHVAPKMG